jgi:selenocysteine-specific elongation factor
VDVRALIIGTSGHVDHGKTEIVKALTGHDTDRLKEEKERGISIVLGFAPIDLGPGITAGVVDVPGHERFVKTMVSGAVGVDLALLVVAADEGVMPQTEEHFEVLRLLGVKGLVIAITKADLVDEELMELVESEVRSLIAGTAFEGAPIVRTSSVTGQGIAELKEILCAEALRLGERESADFFRMPIDRIWTKSGIGTIVTGTAWSGEVHKGDELEVEPEGRAVRVREVQSFDRSLERAAAGMRTALALHGVKFDEIAAGSQVLTPEVLEPSGMLDAAVEMSTLAGGPLVTRQRIRFHHAANEIIGRVVLLEGEGIEPGGSGYIQIRLEKPAVARRGDRFILRSYSPQHVIGGGRVLDPTPVKARRPAAAAPGGGSGRDGAAAPAAAKAAAKPRSRAAALATGILPTLAKGTDEDVLVALASRAGRAGFPRREMRKYGLQEAEGRSLAASLEKAGRLVSIEGRLFDAAVVKGADDELRKLVEARSSANRLAWGMEREEARERSGLREGPLFDYLMEKGRGEGTLFFKGGLVRVGSGERALSPEDRRVLDSLEARVRAAGFSFAEAGDLRKILPDEKRLASYLKILAEQGSIVRIASDSYMHAEHYRALVARIGERLDAAGALSIGDLKELFGFSRKYAVPILEHLDREGVTRREGDVRKAGPKLAEKRSRS